jgi:hypothetical protein
MTAIAIFSATEAHAQIDLSKFEVGIQAGTFIYQGDLTPSRVGSYRTMKPGIGITVNRIINPHFLISAQYNRGKLYGNDASYSKPVWRQQRNFNFTTPVKELSARMIYDIYGENGEERSRQFSPYIFAGVAWTRLKIARDYSNFNAEYFSTETVAAGLSTDASQALPDNVLAVPVGAGIRYVLNNRFSLTAETSYRLMSTDYLDGFSQAANPKRNDHYMSHTIGILYSFGKKFNLKCPVIKP